MIPMEMKTKKNKMFLAMAVVVAFAMVSVAGVAAFSDDSDAAQVGGIFTYTIDRDDSAMVVNVVVETVTYNGAEIGVAIGNISVEPGVTVTGTINIGYKNSAGQYVVTDSLKLTNASGFNITVLAVSLDDSTGAILSGYNIDGSISLFAIGGLDLDTPTSGDYELTKGEALLGSVPTAIVQAVIDGLTGGPFNPMDLLDSVTPFNGNLKVKGLELDAVDVAGTIVSAEGATAILTGGAATLPVIAAAGDSAKLTIKGTAIVDWPAEIKSLLTFVPSGFLGLSSIPQGFVAYDAEVIIAADADITVGKIEPLAVQEFHVETGDDVYIAFLYSASGRVFEGYTGYGATNEAYFFDVPTGTYTLVLITTANDVIYSTNFVVSGSMGTYTVSLGNNRVAPGSVTPGEGGNMDIAELTFGTEIGYPAYFTGLYAFNIDTYELGVVASGEITFENGYTAGDEIIFIAANRGTTGNPIQVYFGDNTANTFNTALLVRNTVASGEIYPGSDVYSQDSEGYIVLLNSELTVEGTLKFLYQSDVAPSIKGIMMNPDGHITMKNNGVIEYGVFPGTVPIVPFMGDIDAAYYFKNVIDSNVVTKSTYYFTTITKAINDSDGADITLIGFHEIIVDTNWSVDKPTKIIIGDGVQPTRLNIGRYNPPVDETKTAALTIDEQIEIIVVGGADFEVMSGQAIFLGGTEPIFPPTAHVRIVNPDKIIYADVATGFTIVKSGETLELIDDGELRSDATLIAGATFDDMGYDMVIPVGMTLTVNGKYQSQAPGKLIIERDATGVGTLVINNGTATFEAGTEIELKGSLKINAAGTMTLDGSMDGKGTGILIIDGIFDANRAVVDLGELVLRGTLNIRANIPFSVSKKITIGAEPVLLTALQNNAVLNGVIDIDDLTLILVYGNSAIGVANFNNPGDIVSTKFVYQNLSTVYATQYGVDGAVPAVANLEYLTCDALRDFKLVGWYQSAGLSILGEVTPAQFLVSAVGEYPVLFGDFVPKTFTITFQDTNQGINWLVDGVGKGASNVLTFNYGEVVRVNVHVLQGFTGTPVIQKDGAAYAANTPFTVTDNYVFTVSGVSVADRSSGDGDGLTLIEILLIIIVIIIGIISIFVALRLLRS